MGYTILDCFLCAFSTRADNSLSKKGKMFVQLIFMFSAGLQKVKKLVSAAFFVAMHENKNLDLNQHKEI